MIRLRPLLPLAVVLAFACRASSSPAPSPSPGALAAFDSAAVVASARAEIEAANADWLPGLQAHDADRIVAAFADTGVFVTVDGESIRGRAAIAAMYRARFARLAPTLRGGITPVRLWPVRADLVVEVGRGWLEQTGAEPGAAAVRSGGAYVTLWQRQDDGHWRIARNAAL